MAGIDPKEVVKFLYESRSYLREEDEGDDGIKEGSKVKIEVDGEKKEGEVIEIHDGNARVKCGEDIHTAKVEDLEKA